MVKKVQCPYCQDAGDVHEIIYGMPGHDFDFEKYEVGGCLVFDEQPDYRCRVCDWVGFKKPLTGRAK
jgi:hypothetical protein